MRERGSPFNLDVLDGETDQMKGLPQPPLELECDKGGAVIDLPNPREIKLGGVNLRKVIENRRSVRNYSKRPLTAEELSYLLWCTQGVQRLILRRSFTLRNVPSAGARHALETYLLANNVEGLQGGIYRFLAIEHKLAEVNMESNLVDKITKACVEQEFIKRSAVIFIWTAVPYRMNWRYGERGHKYI